MHRFPRLFPRLSAFGLFGVIVGLTGVAACHKLPLLAPTGTVINLTVASDTASVNSSIDVIAVLIENGQQSGGTGTGTAATSSSTTGAGTPVQDGTVVSFTTSIGTIDPAEAKTVNGKVSVKLNTGTTSGTATVTAYSGGAKSTAQIKIGTANAKTVTVTGSPQNLSANGGTSTISARVDDSNGNGVAGAQVQFTTTKGTVSPATVTTNASGIATTTLTTTASADVTAAVAGLSGKVSIGVSSRATLTITGPTAAVPVSAAASFTVSAGSGSTVIPLTSVSVSYGDGSSKSLGTLTGSQTLTHAFGSAGIYDVTVTGTDPDGVVNTATAQVAVTSLSGTLTASSSTITRGTAITFTATVAQTTAAIDHYLWDFGDGTSATSTSGAQSHVYALTVPSGTITVAVRVYPQNGDTFLLVTQLSIPAQRGSLSLSAASSSIAQSAPLVFTVDPGTAVTLTNVTLSYGDGTSKSFGTLSASRTDTKFYSATGTYTATATGTDPDGNTVSSGVTITVTPLAATVSASSATITRGTAITYTAAVTPSAAQVSSYVWDFGDGTTATSTSTTQSKVYATSVAAGTITVSVRVVPVYGNAITATLPMVIAASRGTITLTAPNNTSGTAFMSTATSFTIDAGTSVALTNISIDYGDGTSRTLGTFSGTRTDTKFYATPSTTAAYTVRATGTDPDGNIVSSSLQLFVQRLSGTLAITTAGSSTTTTVLTFTIGSGQTSALIDRYSWDFGDNSASAFADTTTGTSPAHQYARGVWLAKVTVYPTYGSPFIVTISVPIN